jgi:hypothetical protein
VKISVKWLHQSSKCVGNPLSSKCARQFWPSSSPCKRHLSFSRRSHSIEHYFEGSESTSDWTSYMKCLLDMNKLNKKRLTSVKVALRIEGRDWNGCRDNKRGKVQMHCTGREYAFGTSTQVDVSLYNLGNSFELWQTWLTVNSDYGDIGRSGAAVTVPGWLAFAKPVDFTQRCLKRISEPEVWLHIERRLETHHQALKEVRRACTLPTPRVC